LVGIDATPGAPTRLLDWTKSIYVALYFAVEQSPDRDGAIWFVHQQRLSANMHSTLASGESVDTLLEGPGDWFRNPSAPDAVWFWEETTQTNRMAAQQGIFLTSRQALADYGSVIGQTMLSMIATEKSLRPTNSKMNGSGSSDSPISLLIHYSLAAMGSDVRSGNLFALPRRGSRVQISSSAPITRPISLP